jgi:hypothetical protein
MASSSVSSTQDLASGTAAQSSERELLASLKQIRATDRIVLRFTPDSSGLNSLPDIAFEDGDHFGEVRSSSEHRGRRRSEQLFLPNGTWPQGLKPTFFSAFAARLKSCPVTKHRLSEIAKANAERLRWFPTAVSRFMYPRSRF